MLVQKRHFYTGNLKSETSGQCKCISPLWSVSAHTNAGLTATKHCCADAQAVNGSGYKWMLYGDDDTLWFVGGVLDLLKDLDPEMPYVITGGSPPVCPMSSQVGHP